MFASEWLVHQEKDPHFEQANVEDLAANLRTFYACARSADGNLYSKSSLTNLRAGLNRYLTSPPYSRQINLMHDIAFQSANQVFVGMVRKLRQDGLDKTRHKDAIRASDMKKLYECGTLSTDDPVGLQRKVYIEVCLHFCRRGREGLRELRKESFVIQRDENEREYVTLGYNELEKNHQGINKHDIAEEPRMYSQRGDVCPVESFKKYISKLNENCSAFFQRPNLNYRKSGQWYCNVPIGKNTLATMMKTISEAAGLSKKYTNHCLRVTAISVLSAQGVEDRDICSVSRHKNPGSLKPYCPGPDDEKRFSMSSKLHGHGKPKTALIPVASQSAASPKPSTSRGLPEIELDVGDSESAVVPAVTPTADTATHGPIANSNTTISNRSDNIVQRALFAGAHFEANCAPVFHFHGNFNFNWLWRLFLYFFWWCKCRNLTKVPQDEKVLYWHSTALFVRAGVGGGEMM